MKSMSNEMNEWEREKGWVCKQASEQKNKQNKQQQKKNNNNL